MRYKEQNSLVLVHLTGPTFFSAEPILARNSEELNLIKTHGFSKEKILKAWQEIISTFKESFHQPLALNIHYIIKSNTYLSLPEKIINIAQNLLGNRLIIQGNWFSPKHVIAFVMSKPLPDSKLIKLVKSSNTRGLQEVVPFTKLITFYKNKYCSKLLTHPYIHKLLDKLSCSSYYRSFFEKFGIDYIEIYPDDLNLFLPHSKTLHSH